MNRLIYYPTGCYGTFVQWLCNTQTIAGAEDLPFHTDGNSHRYVMNDQYRLLVTAQCEQEFVSTDIPTVVSCIWPLESNGRQYNENNEPDFYFKLSKQHLGSLAQDHIKILVLHPTPASEIWWYHNNVKKVYYTNEMFDKKVNHSYQRLPWLTCADDIKRACFHMEFYYQRTWFKILMLKFNCKNLDQLSLGQLRHLMAVARYEEMADYLSHWSLLHKEFPNIKFLTLDQLRDQTKQTILEIFEYFDVQSQLPLDYVVDQWTQLQITRYKDTEHQTVINCIVNEVAYDWDHLNFDFFDEIYLYYRLRYKHKIILNANNIDRLPTNTHDLLQLR